MTEKANEEGSYEVETSQGTIQIRALSGREWNTAQSLYMNIDQQYPPSEYPMKNAEEKNEAGLWVFKKVIVKPSSEEEKDQLLEDLTAGDWTKLDQRVNEVSGLSEVMAKNL